MQVRCLVAAVLIAAAGCAALDPRASQIIAADDIVAEILRASRAPAAEQKAALARAEQAFLGQGSPDNRLRLAGLLGTLPAPLHDDARAAELLERIGLGDRGDARPWALSGGDATDGKNIRRLPGGIVRPGRDGRISSSGSATASPARSMWQHLPPASIERSLAGYRISLLSHPCWRTRICLRLCL